jgi:hypothetical protein
MSRYDYSGTRLTDTAGYQKIERAIWMAAPIIVLLLVLGNLAMRSINEQQERDRHQVAVLADRNYCEKWGVPVDSQAFATCVGDLMGIRVRTEERVRAAKTSDF